MCSGAYWKTYSYGFFPLFYFILLLVCATDMQPQQLDQLLVGHLQKNMVALIFQKIINLIIIFIIFNCMIRICETIASYKVDRPNTFVAAKVKPWWPSSNWDNRTQMKTKPIKWVLSPLNQLFINHCKEEEDERVNIRARHWRVPHDSRNHH